MIIVQGHMRLNPGDIDANADALNTMVTATRAEDGCILYAFARDVIDPDTIHITERWRDQAAIDAHGTSAHMGEFRKVIGAVKPLDFKVTLFDATAKERA